MNKKQEKTDINVNEDEKIDEETENETDLKKWKGFEPQKKKRGSYFIQLKKLKGQQKKVVSFQVSPRNKKRASKPSEKRKSSDKVSISVTKAEDDNNDVKSTQSKNEMGVIVEEKEKNNDMVGESQNRPEKKFLLPEDMTNESSDGEVIPPRNAMTIGVMQNHEKSSSSDEEGGVQNYQKWDSFNPQKKRKRPLSFANPKRKNKNIAKPSNFMSTRPSYNNPKEEEGNAGNANDDVL